MIRYVYQPIVHYQALEEIFEMIAERLRTSEDYSE